jgi:hypothetical protein
MIVVVEGMVNVQLCIAIRYTINLNGALRLLSCFIVYLLTEQRVSLLIDASTTW